MRESPRVGLRALMAAASVDPETVDAGALGFRLAPRINAAGRLYRADAGVELMLTDDPDRAAAIAAELDKANAERRWAEQKVVEGAQRARSALPAELKDAPALVLAGEGWHAGRRGDRSLSHGRAVLPTRPSCSPSTMAGPRDRPAAFPASTWSPHLTQPRITSTATAATAPPRAWSWMRSESTTFREAFIEHAASEIAQEDLIRKDRLDALVGVGREGIGMDLARQLETLGPFGMGNPGPRLLVPSGRLREVRPLGQEGKHSRFQLESGAGRAAGVAFGMNGEISRREDQALDLSVELEVDRWNGAEQPRVVVRELYPLDGADGDAEAPSLSARGCPSPDAEWWERLEHEAERVGAGRPGALLDVRAPDDSRRERVDRRGGAAVASLAELISSGESVLAICADAARRARLASAAADPRRFGASQPRIACCRCGSTSLDSALRASEGAGLALIDWTVVARRPDAVCGFRHVVAIDPAPSETLEDLAQAGTATCTSPGGRRSSSSLSASSPGSGS